jgi:hypothetical protein
MSYTGARRIPHADGPRHRANYWAAAQILLSNVGGSYAVAMKDEAAQLVRASKHAPSHFALAPVSTLGTSAIISRTETSKRTYVHIDSLNLNRHIPTVQS